MTAAAQADLRVIAATRWPRMNHKGRLRELSRLLSWSARRVRAIYNAEAGVSIRAAEAADIASLFNEADEDAVRASQANHRALEARLADVEALLLARQEERNRRLLD